MKKLLYIFIGLSILLSSAGTYSYAYTPTNVSDKNCININKLKEHNSYTIKRACQCKTCTVQIYKYLELSKLIEQLEKQININKNRLIESIQKESKKTLADTNIFIFDASKNVINIIDKITPENWNVVKPVFYFLRDKKYTWSESLVGVFTKKIMSTHLEPKTAQIFSNAIKNSLHHSRIESSYQHLNKNGVESYWIKYYNFNDLLKQLSTLINDKKWIGNNYILLSFNDNINDRDTKVEFKHSDIIEPQGYFAEKFEETSKKINNILEQIKNDDNNIPDEEELSLYKSKLYLSDAVISKIAYLCTNENLTYKNILERSINILSSFFKSTHQSLDMATSLNCPYTLEEEKCLMKKIVDIINKNPEAYIYI